jgi:hypothetical protein
MADIDQTLAAQVKVPAPPDVIGPIQSLAQLQYMQANAQRMQAETAGLGLTNQFTQSKLQSLQSYNDAISGGATPEDALSKSGLAGYDPTGANAILGNAQTGLTLKGERGYAANPQNPYSAAAGGPALVGQAATGAQTLATTANTQADVNIKGLQIMGQIGSVMANDPSPAGRAQAQALATANGAPQQLIQQVMALPDDQYVAAGKHFQQASMSPEQYMNTPAQKAQAEANFKPIITEPQQGVVAPPGLANVLYPDRAGGAPAPTPGNPALSNFGTPAAGPAGPSLSNPTGAPAAGPIPAAPMPTGAAAPITAAALNQPGVTRYANGTTTGPAPATAAITRAAPPPGVPPANASAGGMGSPGLSNNKNNNPGNIRDGSFAQQQPGYLGSNGGFAVFQSPLLGQAAMEKNLMAYGRQGINTPLAIASKWAPAGDGANNPTSYANFIAGRLGIGPNDKIDVTDPAQRSALAVAMSQQENGAKGLLGPNVSGPLVGGTLAPGSTNAAQAIPGAAPLASVPSIPGSTPILPPQMSNAQPLAQPRPALAPPPAPPPLPATTAPVAPTQPPPPPPAVAPALAPQVAGAARPALPIVPAAASGPSAGAPAIPPTGPVTLQPGMTIAEQAAQRATGEGIAAAQVKQFGEAKEAYQSASTAQMKINELQHNLANLPSSGLLTPGSGATERIGLAKYANTLLGVAGAAPMFDPKEVASAEAAQKITGGLGFDMSRTMGSREAAQIVHQAISLNPGAENTPQGAKVVAGAINAGLQRQKDFYQFLSENGNKPNSDIAFNRMYPVAHYVQEAQALAKIPQPAIDLIQQHPDSPTLASYFEQHYGPGMSRYFTGQ